MKKVSKVEARKMVNIRQNLSKMCLKTDELLGKQEELKNIVIEIGENLVDILENGKMCDVTDETYALADILLNAQTKSYEIKNIIQQMQTELFSVLTRAG